ncbi:MAG TPA: DUF1565 domain-containing protein, partial [Thermoplasmata archaeon]|nr:DUF1565 domain-containing protein [Thermoplasmata archaeon]
NNGISVTSSVRLLASNTSIADSSSNDWELATNAEATSINVSFAWDGVTCDLTSRLVVRNYLTVRIVNQAHDPLKGADVTVTDNNYTVYATEHYSGTDPRTDHDGRIAPLLLTDRIYDGSNQATQNWTNASAWYDGNETTVEVNMSTSHVEEIVVKVSLEGIVFVDDDNAGDPQMNGSLEHPYDTIHRGIDNATDGDTVRVFAGLYEESIVVDREVTITGNGTETVIKADEDHDGILVDAANVTLRSLQINRSAGSATGVNVTNAGRNCTLVHLSIRGFPTGVRLSGARNITIRDLTVWNPITGIILTGVHHARITDSVLAGRDIDRSRTALDISDSDNVTVGNCSIDTFRSAILADNTSDIVVRDGGIKDVERSVYLTGSGEGLTVEHNTIDNATEGIYVGNTSAGARAVRIEGNDLSNITRWAILINGSTTVRVLWNNVSRADGVVVTSCNDTYVENNTIDNTTLGLRMDGIIGSRAANNTIRDVEDNGMEVLSSRPGIGGAPPF